MKFALNAEQLGQQYVVSIIHADFVIGPTNLFPILVLAIIISSWLSWRWKNEFVGLV